MKDLSIYKNRINKILFTKIRYKKLFLGGINYPPLLHHVKAI